MRDIKKDAGQDITTVDYKSYKTIADDLYDGKIEAIIMDEATRSLFEDNHSKFDSETKIVKSYKYKTTTKDISKNVNVTSEHLMFTLLALILMGQYQQYPDLTLYDCNSES